MRTAPPPPTRSINNVNRLQWVLIIEFVGIKLSFYVNFKRYGSFAPILPQLPSFIDI